MFVVNNFVFSCKMVIILSEWVKFGQGTSFVSMGRTLEVFVVELCNSVIPLSRYFYRILSR